MPSKEQNRLEGMSNKKDEADKVLDTSGLSCPLPAVKTALTLEKMAVGETLEVITTDEISQTDLPVWCEQTGNECVDMYVDRDVIHIFVRKAEK